MAAIKRLPDHIKARIIAPTTEDGCWEWCGAKMRRGYGTYGAGKGFHLAHRLVYGLTVGEIPAGREIDHLCRNHGCVNPNHLEAVTHRENVLRGNAHAAVNARKNQCPKGHPLSGDNLHPHYLKLGRRYCLICSRARGREYMARIRARRRNDTPKP